MRSPIASAACAAFAVGVAVGAVISYVALSKPLPSAPAASAPAAPAPAAAAAPAAPAPAAPAAPAPPLPEPASPPPAPASRPPCAPWPGLDEAYTAHALPPSAHSSLPRTVSLSPLEAFVLRHCAIPEDAPGGICASLEWEQRQTSSALAPSGVLFYGPCGSGAQELARWLQQSPTRPRALSLTRFMLERVHESRTALLASAAFALACKIAPLSFAPAWTACCRAAQRRAPRTRSSWPAF